MEWKEYFSIMEELILATASKKGEPNAIVVISMGLEKDKLIIADCQMDKTIKNIKENNKVAIVSNYHRILGTAEIFKSGKYYDICVEECEGYEVKNAVVVDIESVFNLDKLEVVYEKKPKSTKTKTTTKKTKLKK